LELETYYISPSPGAGVNHLRSIHGVALRGPIAHGYVPS